MRIKGPKLYNLIVDDAKKLQLTSAGTDLHLERLYLNPFKNEANDYLAHRQSIGDHEWSPINSALDILNHKI